MTRTELEVPATTELGTSIKANCDAAPGVTATAADPEIGTPEIVAPRVTDPAVTPKKDPLKTPFPSEDNELRVPLPPTRVCVKTMELVDGTPVGLEFP